VTAGDRRRLSVVHVVVTDSFAGVERYVCQVVNELTARGHRVTTIGGDPQRMRSELDAGVRSQPANTLARAAFALARQAKADIVHLHMTTAEGAAWLARPMQRAPLVATRHFARDRGSSALARALSRVTSRSLARDIAISTFVAQRISGPSTLIPNGVQAQDQAALQSTTAVMLQRLNSEKAPEVGIRAWALSGLGGVGWRLVIAGDGGLRPALVGLADELGVADSVEFVGHVTETDRLLAQSSILLAPAPEEPFGLSVVEAMAHGVPVVAAAGGAHLETVGSEGILFAPDDPSEAAAALSALGHDRSLRLSMGTRLRRRQQATYSLTTHVDRLEDLYREVIDEVGAHSR
jgi:glycosyltransferase involved in cell wall biosynthesis